MNQTIPPISYLQKSQPARGWLQFSMRTALIVTTLFALVFGAIAAPPLFAIGAAISFVLVSPILIVLAVFGRGWVQAFAIGALVPHIISYLAVIEGFRSPEGVIIAVLVSIGATVLFGLATACTHGVVRRCGGKIPVPNLPIIRNWLTNE